ncbi:MAG: PQQ-dependent sugar dehydrogenase [Bacteroidetes bacterium]|nr:PQQ-dependent sugar dehydrogenase [Bacteroidota bacterium]
MCCPDRSPTHHSGYGESHRLALIRGLNHGKGHRKGHRNPQGLAWHPETGELYASEHGKWRYDEINIIKKGGNYGWPIKQCDDTYMTIKINDSFIDPIFCPKDWTLAPSGMTFVNEKNHPWYGNLFVAGLRGKHLHRFVIEDNKVVYDEIFFVNIDTQRKSNLDRRIRDVEFYNGSLWILSDWSGIAKLTPR